MTDLAPAFIETTTEQQILELASFVVTLQEEDPEASALFQELKELASEKHFEKALSILIDSCGPLFSASERDIEAAFNLLFLMVREQCGNRAIYIKTILKSFQDHATDNHFTKLKILSNLYNGLDNSNSLRYNVFQTILFIASSNDDMEVLLPLLKPLDLWMKEWCISPEEVRSMYSDIRNLMQKHHQRSEAQVFLLKYLGTFSAQDYTDMVHVKQVVIEAIVSAIKNEDNFSFEDLFNLAVVKSLKGEKIHDLLAIFLKGNLDTYYKFAKENAAVLKSLGLSNEECVRKMRFLSIVSLAEGATEPLSYHSIATTLGVPEEDVEIWIIDAIRAGLISAKLNQLQQTVMVTRYTSRLFTNKQWNLLKHRLDSWKSNLNDLKQVVTNAKFIAQTQDVANMTPVANV